MNFVDMISDVTLFHKTFGHPTLPLPEIPHPDRQVLRNKLIRDEYIKEFDPAWAKCADAYKSGQPISPAALAEFGDVIADLIYYLIGTALEYGIPLGEIWQEVQRANMAKLWSSVEIAKVGEQPGWRYNRVIPCSSTIDSDLKAYVAYDETGKVRKPPSWKEPDIVGIILKRIENNGENNGPSQHPQA